MKKILSLALAALMLVSMIPTAMAAENDWQDGTTIKLVGSQESAGESYTVTVPAELQPGQEGWVSASGNWSSKQTLMISCPNSVTLTYGDQTMTVNITSADYGGENGVLSLIEWVGSDTEASSVDGHIKVEEATALFGTWTGHLTYTVEMVTEEAKQISFFVQYPSEEPIEYNAIKGTTWSEWLSDGNNNAEYGCYELAIEDGKLVILDCQGPEPVPISVEYNGNEVQANDQIIASAVYEYVM